MKNFELMTREQIAATTNANEVSGIAPAVVDALGFTGSVATAITATFESAAKFISTKTTDNEFPQLATAAAHIGNTMRVNGVSPEPYDTSLLARQAVEIMSVAGMETPDFESEIATCNGVFGPIVLRQWNEKSKPGASAVPGVVAAFRIEHFGPMFKDLVIKPKSGYLSKPTTFGRTIAALVGSSYTEYGTYELNNKNELTLVPNGATGYNTYHKLRITKPMVEQGIRDWLAAQKRDESETESYLNSLYKSFGIFSNALLDMLAYADVANENLISAELLADKLEESKTTAMEFGRHIFDALAKYMGYPMKIRFQHRNLMLAMQNATRRVVEPLSESQKEQLKNITDPKDAAKASAKMRDRTREFITVNYKRVIQELYYQLSCIVSGRPLPSYKSIEQKLEEIEATAKALQEGPTTAETAKKRQKKAASNSKVGKLGSVDMEKPADKKQRVRKANVKKAVAAIK